MGRVRRLAGKGKSGGNWSAYRENAATLIRRFDDWQRVGFAPETGARVGVVVTPWLRSMVPFFGIECALRLASAGSRVTIFWDHANILGNAAQAVEVEIIAQVVAKLPPQLRAVDVCALPVSPTAASVDAEIESIIRENAIRTTMGESGIDDFIATKPAAFEDTRQHLSKIHHLLESAPVDWILIPGGIYGTSSGYVAMARKLGIGVTTYDSDSGMLLFAHDGVACHQVDIAEAYRRLDAEVTADERAWVVDEAFAEMKRRIGGRDDLQLQVTAASGKAFGDFNILVPLNLRWDSAALGRQRLFPTVREWLTGLVQWAEGEPRARLCIRQHPCERHEALRGSDDMTDLLARINRLGDRVRFVAATDTVSSYDIMQTVKVILPFTSTIALEGAMEGRLPIISTWCYYSGFDFAWNAETVEEYFELIRKGIADELTPPATAKDTAAFVYYLTQRCNQMRTLFTPWPIDFPKWSALGPRELWQSPELEDLFQSLTTREPLSSIRCRRAIRQRARETA